MACRENEELEVVRIHGFLGQFPDSLSYPR